MPELLPHDEYLAQRAGRRRRVKLAWLGEQHIASMIRLPEGLLIEGIHWDSSRQCLFIAISKEDWPTVPSGVEPPLLNGEWTAVLEEEDDFEGERKAHIHLEFDYEGKMDL